MDERYIIIPHKTNLSYRFDGNEETTIELEMHLIFDIVNQRVITVCNSLEEAKIKIEELKKQVSSRPRMK
ncbi:hypothetical protein IG612_17465 [Pectobacterium sp. FL60-S17]|uniref:Uncharacterized protein n=1 Tax=Pectobacterium quasiaquaticum TaxID=2774015 RepID=A0A9Q2ET87_9GAMM|nr:hypothetical protein [Pectobacterium quasiaquaticum]MBE5204370.1 hypothetical protein [Pectobacterium quasiaquaticum]MBE5210598.1 hypothetical protein [Pectobacterium quasiaquaticum]MBE5212539.1 hypothetical protein [Pectobacterium quasiaquaticum]MBE5221294.1 hypothetical protein [Pectobacterium quasiaquaticum]MBE5225655.1 hypothetical protein [Pectobacterium quasiaquaticum]